MSARTQKRRLKDRTIGSLIALQLRGFYGMSGWCKRSA
jgi:hypothetical protein